MSASRTTARRSLVDSAVTATVLRGGGQWVMLCARVSRRVGRGGGSSSYVMRRILRHQSPECSPLPSDLAPQISHRNPISHVVRTREAPPCSWSPRSRRRPRQTKAHTGIYGYLDGAARPVMPMTGCSLPVPVRPGPAALSGSCVIPPRMRRVLRRSGVVSAGAGRPLSVGRGLRSFTRQFG
jgi:hypothetical protein